MRKSLRAQWDNTVNNSNQAIVAQAEKSLKLMKNDLCRKDSLDQN